MYLIRIYLGVIYAFPEKQKYLKEEKKKKKMIVTSLWSTLEIFCFGFSFPLTSISLVTFSPTYFVHFLIFCFTKQQSDLALLFKVLVSKAFPKVHPKSTTKK